MLHPAQDVVDGVLWYGVPVDGALVAITSARQAYRADRLPEGHRAPPHRPGGLDGQPRSGGPLAHRRRVGLDRAHARRAGRVLPPLRRAARPADGALGRRLGARDLVLPRVPGLPVPVDPLGGEAVRQEPAARAPGPRLLQRLPGDGASDRGAALPLGRPDRRAPSSSTRWRRSGATRTASTR